MYTVVVDMEKCDGCGSCVEICPVSVFVMDGDKSIPENMDECTGCESCVETCEQMAITVTES